MNYYQFNIGDYKSHTSHLDPIEDIAYRRMLDWYYLHESPLPDSVEQIAKKICMREHCDRIADVLREFFTLDEYGWQHRRANKEIEAYREKSDKAKASANARWAKNRDATALRPKCESNAKQETRNTKQETLDIADKPSRFTPPTKEQVFDYFFETGLNSNTASDQAERFINFYDSKNWYVGKNKMKSWAGAAGNWLKRYYDDQAAKTQQAGKSQSWEELYNQKVNS